METTIGQVSGEYGSALLFIIGALLFVVGGLFVSRLLSPNRPNPEKLSTYECGEDPVGNARIQMNSRFYLPAIIFLIFDVEVIFLFPWATVYADRGIMGQVPNWGWFAVAEAAVFVGILLLGLAYVWRKGDLDWVRPTPMVPRGPAQVPDALYEEFNAAQARPRA